MGDGSGSAAAVSELVSFSSHALKLTSANIKKSFVMIKRIREPLSNKFQDNTATVNTSLNRILIILGKLEKIFRTIPFGS